MDEFSPIAETSRRHDREHRAGTGSSTRAGFVVLQRRSVSRHDSSRPRLLQHTGRLVLLERVFSAGMGHTQSCWHSRVSSPCVLCGNGLPGRWDRLRGQLAVESNPSLRHYRSGLLDRRMRISLCRNEMAYGESAFDLVRRSDRDRSRLLARMAICCPHLVKSG